MTGLGVVMVVVDGGDDAKTVVIEVELGMGKVNKTEELSRDGRGRSRLQGGKARPKRGG